jgi:hypothetical protein
MNHCFSYERIEDYNDDDNNDDDDNTMTTTWHDYSLQLSWQTQSMLLALRVRSVSGEGGGMIRGVLSSHGRDNQPSVYGWNRRWPLRVKSVSGEGGGMIRGDGRDNQPSVYGWNRRWPLRVRSVSGEGGGMPSTASPSSLPVLISQCVIATPQP